MFHELSKMTVAALMVEMASYFESAVTFKMCMSHKTKSLYIFLWKINNGSPKELYLKPGSENLKNRLTSNCASGVL